MWYTRQQPRQACVAQTQLTVCQEYVDNWPEIPAEEATGTVVLPDTVVSQVEGFTARVAEGQALIASWAGEVARRLEAQVALDIQAARGRNQRVYCTISAYCLLLVDVLSVWRCMEQHGPKCWRPRMGWLAVGMVTRVHCTVRRPGCLPDGWRNHLGASKDEMVEEKVRSVIIANPSLANGLYVKSMDRLGQWCASLRPEVLEQDMATVMRAKEVREQARAHAASQQAPVSRWHARLTCGMRRQLG